MSAVAKPVAACARPASAGVSAARRSPAHLRAVRAARPARSSAPPASPAFAPARARAASRPGFACRATDSSGYIEDEGFDLSKVSFGSIAAPVGLTLLIYGFGAYISLLPGADASAVMLVYGFPITLIGFALKYAELKPVECKTTPEALALRETQMTDIQKSVREDTTRFKYGDEQHLDEALSRVFKFGRPDGLPKRQAPVLVGLREEVMDGAYTLVMEFESPKMSHEEWEKFQPKFQSFFGPGITALLIPKEDAMDVALICDGSGDGRGGGERKEMLPPLMPGLAARVSTLDD